MLLSGAASPRARAEHLQLGDPVPVTDGSQALLIDVNAWNDHHDPRLTQTSDACVTTVARMRGHAGFCGWAGVARRVADSGAGGVDVCLGVMGSEVRGRADAGRFTAHCLGLT